MTDIIKSSLETFLKRAIASEEGRRLAIEIAFQDIQVISITTAEPEIRERFAQLGKNATALAQLVEDLLDYTEETED